MQACATRMAVGSAVEKSHRTLNELQGRLSLPNVVTSDSHIVSSIGQVGRFLAEQRLGFSQVGEIS